jgi:hypothetical protein
MTTIDEQYRARLLAAAQRVQEQEAQLKAYLVKHLRMGQAEAAQVIACDDPKELSKTVLQTMVCFHYGLSEPYAITAQQILILRRSRLTGAELAEFDRLALKEESDRLAMPYHLWELDQNRAVKEPPPRPPDYDLWKAELHGAPPPRP